MIGLEGSSERDGNAVGDSGRDAVDTRASRSRLYAPLPAGTRPLKVVVLVDRLDVPAWVGETIAEITACDAAELVAVVAIEAETPPRYSWLLDLYLRLDNRMAGQAAIATAECSLRSRLAGVPITQLGRCAPDTAALELADADLQTIRALGADVLISFGLPAAGGRLAATARHGAWSFGVCATHPLYTGLRFLDPIIDGNPVTVGGLAVHSSESGEWRVLQPSWSATSLLSLARNRAYQLLRRPAALARALRELAVVGTVRSVAAAEFSAPGALTIAMLAPRLVLRALARKGPRWMKLESWLIGVRREVSELDPGNPDLDGVHALVAPPGYYWADPCPVRRDGRDYVFIEDYEQATSHGRISVLELDENLAVASRRNVLDKPWHLSYPFVFEWQGETYMIVESAEARRLTLYRSTRFPDEWSEVGDLLQGWGIVDATLHCEAGRWYLFANITEVPFGYDQRIWDDLFLFHAQTPLGPWHPHPRNPIVSDVRSARPAGRLFMHAGRLIRPSQDCSTDYGAAVVFNEVVAMDESNYSERPIGRIDPTWMAGLSGCHTYSKTAGLETVDGKFFISRRGARRRPA